jgi:hypothetical protein
MHGEKLRKFTKTHARAPRAPCIDFLPIIGTVQSLSRLMKVLVLVALWFGGNFYFKIDALCNGRELSNNL